MKSVDSDQVHNTCTSTVQTQIEHATFPQIYGIVFIESRNMNSYFSTSNTSTSPCNLNT